MVYFVLYHFFQISRRDIDRDMSIHEGSVLVPIDQITNGLYVVCFGVNEIAGYDPIKFYVHNHEPNFAVRFTINQNDSHQCLIETTDNPYLWTGGPIFVPVNEEQKSINMTQWLESFSKDLLVDAYEMFEDLDLEPLKKIETFYTQFNQITKLDKGLQIVGTIKSGKPHEMSEYSINYVINLTLLEETPMIGRVGDRRIGYFYSNYRIDTSTQLTGNPVTMINRLNLKRVPWTYVVDRSIPSEYQQSVKEGIISWNRYFEQLGLGQPFKVLIEGDEEYPSEINVFDARYWYIVGTNADNFNGPYSGYSMTVTDYRSGENLYGMISLNLIKIVSNPSRYVVMNGHQPDQTQIFEQYLQQYVAWVTTHEMGHQLGLRHNFMGNFKKDSISTVMDYVDIFNDLTALQSFNPWGTLREYDLIAIEYGYMTLTDEKTGQKHPQLEKILTKLKTPFGTDENYLEKINPLVGTVENQNNPLDYVETVLPIYHNYRNNLVSMVKSGQITSYEYNNMFIYLYTQKYVDLADICLKYLGGRYFDTSRTYFTSVDRDSIIHAVSLLLRLIREYEYTEDEYQYFIYDFVVDHNFQVFNRVSSESIYSVNVENLYGFYQNLINHILKGLTSFSRWTRLMQNGKGALDFTPTDLLYNFTYAVQNTSYDVKTDDGLLPEIGALLIGDGQWQERLFKTTVLKCNCQYSWITRLLAVYKDDEHYLMREPINGLLKQLKSALEIHVLPYLETIPTKSVMPFWRHDNFKLYSHWTSINKLLKDV
jgi:hypothetical protein